MRAVRAGGSPVSAPRRSTGEWCPRDRSSLLRRRTLGAPGRAPSVVVRGGVRRAVYTAKLPRTHIQALPTTVQMMMIATDMMKAILNHSDTLTYPEP